MKERDNLQCQICGDRRGDPYCVLHAHHIVPRAQGGPDAHGNLITLCDLCHAVVTPWWHRPWFGILTPDEKRTLADARQEFMEFLALNPNTRTQRQALLWSHFGIPITPPADA